MAFYNPYIGHSHAAQGRKPGQRQSWNMNRIVPKCLLTAGSKGVFSLNADADPVYFVDDIERPVFPQGLANLSFWASDRIRNPDIDLDAQTLRFHIYDIIETVYTSERCAGVPYRLQPRIVPSGCVLKLLGRLEDGRTVCVNVFGQEAYFFVRSPPDVSVDYVLQQALCSSQRPCAFRTQTERKKLLREYDQQDHEVTRVTLSTATPMAGLADRFRQAGCDVFETNVDAARRFVVDNNFSTFGWYTCSRAEPRIENRDAWTELEFDCGVEDLVFQPEDKSWPPYRILSFDIECVGEKGFPNAAEDEDMVIQISCVLWTVGSEKEPRKVLLNLGMCNPVEDTEVLQFPAELDLLYAFFSLLRDGDIEFLTGYNISNFDVPYLTDRMEHVYGLKPRDFSRVRSGSIFEVHKPRDSGAGFARSVAKVRIAGIVPIDMYIVCKEKLSLSDYKLNTVAKTCVGAEKDDVSYKEIPTLFREGPRGRARIGLYCVKDSALVLDLLKFFMTHVEISEIAKLAMIPPRRVLTDGQQIRVFTCLLAAARRRNYILPADATGSDGYQGATVISPIPGFYNTPVLVVDFASLYPSIIQAHNLCYSTLVPGDALHKHPDLTPEDYETFNLSQGPVHFVKPHKCRSLLAELLCAWLNKRKAIRAELAACSDPSMRTILDKQQLAVKVTCNAVYGFTGVASGLLPCVRIAETVTMRGRNMLDASKTFVEAVTPQRLTELVPENFACEETANFRVIYGDTDSLFIECRGFTMETVNRIAPSLADAVTSALFKPPIRLEAEKVFQCLLLICKKRYVGTLDSGKLVMKGVDLVRKTACRFVQDSTRTILELLLRDPRVQEAAQLLSERPASFSLKHGMPVGFFPLLDELNNRRAELANGSVPVDALTFTTELSRHPDSYKTANLPHLTVYRKIIARNDEPPQIHDRIPYVFVEGTGSLKSELAEHPEYVRQNSVPIAVDLYFDKVVRGAAALLQCIFGNDAEGTTRILYTFLSIPVTMHSK